MNCPFCCIDNNDILFKNSLCFAIYDKFPVNNGHILVIPFRHVSNFFDTTKEEKIAIFELIEISKNFIQSKFNPDGFNLGVNIGHFAGQTIFHVHYHLIPRYKGDIDNPRGGVRGVIPSKRIY